LGLQSYLEGITAKLDPVVDEKGNSSQRPDNGEQREIA